ncbi:MAG: hypothetical protein IT200_17910 [Thermoleophilia bacterium]|nr:hypothetical protein [Thermoleophilia bacterium]
MTGEPPRRPPPGDDDLPPVSSFRDIPGIPRMDDDPASYPKPRPGRPRHAPPSAFGPRRVTLGLAVLMALVAMLVGVALGYTARGGGDPPQLETVEQDLPVVTVTPGR